MCVWVGVYLNQDRVAQSQAHCPKSELAASRGEFLEAIRGCGRSSKITQFDFAGHVVLSATDSDGAASVQPQHFLSERSKAKQRRVFASQSEAELVHTSTRKTKHANFLKI